MINTAPAPVIAGLFCLAALMTVCLEAGSLAKSRTAESAWHLCGQAVAQVETSHDLPEYMLTAIALVESGRRNTKLDEIRAWPWTVTAEGHGRYLPSKAAALAEIAALKAKGVSSIDVGCMQINLHHHPNAFEDMDAALDPVRNVAYAAKLLRNLRQQRGSWTRAVGDYHSATPSRGGAYRVKVFQTLLEERRRVQQARRDPR